MTLVDLRCANALHARFDPETFVWETKCRQCSQKTGKPVYHRIKLLELAERVKRGEVVGICEPTDPRFVHWKVTGS